MPNTAGKSIRKFNPVDMGGQQFMNNYDNSMSNPLEATGGNFQTYINGYDTAQARKPNSIQGQIQDYSKRFDISNSDPFFAYENKQPHRYLNDYEKFETQKSNSIKNQVQGFLQSQVNSNDPFAIYENSDVRPNQPEGYLNEDQIYRPGHPSSIQGKVQQFVEPYGTSNIDPYAVYGTSNVQPNGVNGYLKEVHDVPNVQYSGSVQNEAQGFLKEVYDTSNNNQYNNQYEQIVESANFRPNEANGYMNGYDGNSRKSNSMHGLLQGYDNSQNNLMRKYYQKFGSNANRGQELLQTSVDGGNLESAMISEEMNNAQMKNYLHQMSMSGTPLLRQNGQNKVNYYRSDGVLGGMSNGYGPFRQLDHGGSNVKKSNSFHLVDSHNLSPSVSARGPSGYYEHHKEN